jgi:RNA polymerase sigma-70 factor, ECF subfamily
VSGAPLPFQSYARNKPDVSLPPRESEAILLPQDSEAGLEFFSFDKAYVDRLRDGDPPTEHHFVAYFEKLLRIKLRSRTLTSDKVEDLRQETFIRVIAAVRREGGVRQPERFGAFVNSICNNVLLEHYRSSAKNQPLEESHLELPDKVLDLERMLVTKQSCQRVRQILEEMPERDRALLRAIFLEEKEKDVVCREFGVDRDYLRVLLHRAKDKFRALYEKDQIGIARRAAN